jgi:glycosyltransferase involved in cell wall biosynthesis
MRCDTPVLCSTHASLPELAGDAAILVNPLSIQRIADGIQQLVSDPLLRGQLVQKGREQVKKFTWDIAAQETLTILEQAAQRK